MSSVGKLKQLIDKGFPTLNMGLTKLGKEPFTAITANFENYKEPDMENPMAIVSHSPRDTMIDLQTNDHIPYLGDFMDDDARCYGQSNWDQDLIIVKIAPDGSNYVQYVESYTPSTWSPRSVIGRSFQEVHKDVTLPNGQPGVPLKDSFVKNIAMSGNHFNRLGALVFSIEKSANTMAQTEVADYWTNNGFGGGIFLRYENQSIISLPNNKCFALLFETHVVDMSEHKEMLKNAIENRSKDTYVRTVLDVHGDNILRWCND